MDKLKIKVSIGGRVYPLTIKREEEEDIRKAANNIESIIKHFEANYAVKDKQDLLAMCALQLANRVEDNKGKSLVDSSNFESELSSIEVKLAEMLKRSLT
jgi:cell division protein ZapA